MKLPKKIMILGQEYRIIRVKNLIEKDNIEGYVEAHKYTIAIDKSLSGQVLRRVFYHEVGHAFAFESGLHEILPAASIEQFCQAFSGFIAHLPKSIF